MIFGEFAFTLGLTFRWNMAQVWNFTVRAHAAKPLPPSPPPSPPPPPHNACIACEKQNCPDLAGQGEACAACVEAHAKAFKAAGCFSGGAGDRRAFLTTFCGGG